jgi:DMSO/TMAO reductase YedYZ heme-binding membrane subunit
MTKKIKIFEMILLLIIGVILLFWGIQDTQSKCQPQKHQERKSLECTINDKLINLL